MLCTTVRNKEKSPPPHLGGGVPLLPSMTMTNEDRVTQTSPSPAANSGVFCLGHVEWVGSWVIPTVHNWKSTDAKSKSNLAIAIGGRSPLFLRKLFSSNLLLSSPELCAKLVVRGLLSMFQGAAFCSCTSLLTLLPELISLAEAGFLRGICLRHEFWFYVHYFLRVPLWNKQKMHNCSS